MADEHTAQELTGNELVESHSQNETTLGQSGLRRREMLGALSAGSSLVALSGCSALSGGDDDDTYKMGVHLPLSQGYELLGTSFTNALKLARDEINAQGGLAGREIEFVTEDNGLDPQTGVEVANRMIQQDDVDMILGPVNSTMRNALAPNVKQEEIPMLYWLSYEGPTAEDYCNEYIFKFGEVPTQQWEPAIPWLMDEFGDSFYLIGTNDAYSKTLHQVVTETIDSEGGEVIDDVSVPINHTDFSSTLSNVENADPDILFMTVVGSSVGAIQQQLYNRGLRDQLTEVGTGHGPINLANSDPEHASGVYNSLAYHQGLENDANQQFVSDFRDEFGEDALISPWTGLAYNTLKMLGNAMQGADSASTDEVISRLSDVSIDGVIGEASMGHDHQIELGCNILEVNDDIQFETVESLPQAMPEEQCSGF
jgi:urea transport system substrate-binding protein